MVEERAFNGCNNLEIVSVPAGLKVARDMLPESCVVDRRSVKKR